MNLAYMPLSGQPDRLCDLIAAGISDEYLKRDAESRVRLSVSGGHGALFVCGEVVSAADFDVTHLVQRLLGQHCIHEGVEPFISIEAADSSQVGWLREKCPRPVVGFGYATHESKTGLPRVAHAARLVARLLSDKRLDDPDWFWLGAAGSVSAEELSGRLWVNVTVDGGNRPVESIRDSVQGLCAIWPELTEARLETNPLGASIQAGLKTSFGQSGIALQPYGRALPAVFNAAGSDWHDGRFLADALARQTALRLVRKGSRAAFVRLRYDAGERRPSGIWARDEAGRDLSQATKELIVDLDQLSQEWRRPGLMTEAVRCLMVGNEVLPWENA